MEYLAAEARAKFKEVMDRAEKGETVVIRRHRDVYIIKKPLNKDVYIKGE